MLKNKFYIFLLLLQLLVFSQGSMAEMPPSHTESQQAAAKVFLEEAIRYVHQHGKEQALKAFNDPHGNFYRPQQGLYIAAFETNKRNSAIALANGQTPSLTGQDLYSLEDKLGHYFVRDIVKTCKRGGGWLSFYWKNPQRNGEVDKKWTYAMPVDDTWCIHAGFYLIEEDH